MLTNGQKKALHSAARQAGVPEDMRREIQWHVGGFYSAADKTANRYGFLCVMSFLEAKAGGTLAGCTASYWTDHRDRSSEHAATDFAIDRSRQELGWTPADLDAFIASKHMTSGACDSMEQLTHYWRHRVRSALAAMLKRKAARP
jgi:hypothetical protein